jgi:uncharacterized membrane protein
MPVLTPFVTLLYGVLTFFVIALMFYVLIVGTARILHRFMPVTTPRDSAIEALRLRLAMGEIDEAEFERLRSVLQSR